MPIRIVFALIFGLSRQFFLFSRKFLDFLEGFWIVRTVSSLWGFDRFLESGDFGESGEFGDFGKSDDSDESGDFSKCGDCGGSKESGDSSKSGESGQSREILEYMVIRKFMGCMV